MKKIILVSFALALPALASAQVQLIAGYNFGQFIGVGTPSLDGTTGDPVGSVGSNFTLDSQAPSTSSGDYVANNGLTGGYTNGVSTAYWDGTHGSSNYALNGVEIVAAEVGANSINGATVQGYSLSLQGDGYNLGLTSAVNGGQIAFVTNTVGFGDYDPSAYVDGAGVFSDANFTFAASVSSPVTISWFLNGSGSAFATTELTGSMSAYSLDLPASFYGLSEATLVAQFSGTATIDNLQFNGVVSAVPEPSTYALILGGFAMVGATVYRRFKAQRT